MDETSGQVWKVGQLARLTGLTVRTLHHYDSVGLLRPSAWTASGHRLYDEHDVRQLYRIVALRELGLPLDEIRALLAGRLDLVGLLGGHLHHLDRQLAALRSLRERLGGLVATAQAAGQPSAADLLDLIERTTTMNETMGQYFTAEQLDALARRRERLGEERIAGVQAEWPQLIAEVQVEMEADTDPADPTVQRLARRWMELLEEFHGGDPELRNSLYRMQAEQGEQIRQEYGGPTPELMDYIKRANAVSA